MTAKASPDRLKIDVSEDRFVAWLEVSGMGTPGYTAPTVNEIEAAVGAAKIIITDKVRERISDVVARLAGDPAGAAPVDPSQPNRFLLAEGCPPVDAQDAQFEWSPELAAKISKPDEDEPIDYFNVNSIVTVAGNTAIGRIIPPRPGKPGVDLYGRERPPKKTRGDFLRLAGGCRLVNPETGEVVSETAGRVSVGNGKVKVSEVLEIPGDVDFSTGSVKSCVDVEVRGTVRSNFSVHTTRSLFVDRVIEAADIKVDADVTVRGGVFGQECTGRIRAGGCVSATLLNEVWIKAGGDVRFNKETLNSLVHTTGKLLGERGTVIGGFVYAREGVEVRTLGSEANVVTSIATGIDVATLRRVRKLERKIRDAEKARDQIRESVKPLVANLKRLLPQQRERATELICKADELDLQVDGMQQEARALMTDNAPSEKAYIRVLEVVHPGVQLMIDARLTRVQKPLYGPVKIEMRKVDDATEMVAVNERTGSVTVLNTCDADLDAMRDFDDEAGEQSEADERVSSNK